MMHQIDNNTKLHPKTVRVNMSIIVLSFHRFYKLPNFQLGKRVQLTPFTYLKIKEVYLGSKTNWRQIN